MRYRRLLAKLLKRTRQRQKENVLAVMDAEKALNEAMECIKLSKEKGLYYGHILRQMAQIEITIKDAYKMNPRLRRARR